jgi:hypothetical protein
MPLSGAVVHVLSTFHRLFRCPRARGPGLRFIVDACARLEREFTEEAFAQWSAFRGFC